MKPKALIFDSSAIISLAMNGLLGILKDLKEESGAEFLMTPQVKKEVIENPLNIKRFELEALQILSLLEKGLIEVSSPKNLESETQGFISLANSSYFSQGENIKMLHSGEASCFALAKILKEFDCALVIDERTARVLSEKPENLRALLEKKLHREVNMNEEKINPFRGFNIIRSAELALIAYKKGIISLPAKPKQVVDALLYGVKLNGCSISYEEIEQIKKSFK